MNILYFSQFYAPEAIAPAFRAVDNSRLWAEAGHNVTVFTGYPNYPTGKIFDGYDPKLLSEEEINGVRVLRSKLIAVPNTSIVNRLKNALSYYVYGRVNEIFHSRKIGKEYDVVLGTSGIIFNALLAYKFAKAHKIPFVFEIRDITYVQMQATGKDAGSKSVKGMKWLELMLCRKANKVVVVTTDLRKPWSKRESLLKRSKSLPTVWTYSRQKARMIRTSGLRCPISVLSAFPRT